MALLQRQRYRRSFKRGFCDSDDENFSPRTLPSCITRSLQKNKKLKSTCYAASPKASVCAVGFFFPFHFQTGSYSFAYSMKIILQRQLIQHGETHHTLSAFILVHVVLLLLGKVCLAAVSPGTKICCAGSGMLTVLNKRTTQETGGGDGGSACRMDALSEA